jgi:hypothetical protein
MKTTTLIFSDECRGAVEELSYVTGHSPDYHLKSSYIAEAGDHGNHLRRMPIQYFLARKNVMETDASHYQRRSLSGSDRDYWQTAFGAEYI